MSIVRSRFGFLDSFRTVVSIFDFFFFFLSVCMSGWRQVAATISSFLFVRALVLLVGVRVKSREEFDLCASLPF